MTPGGRRAPVPFRDVNMEVGGLLRDMSMLHEERHGRIAYKRAAVAVLGLEEMLDAVAARRELRQVRYLGPATERIVLEYLEHGTSPTVERAVAASGKRSEIERQQAFRTNFLSAAGALHVLHSIRPGAIGASDYRGDLQMHTEWSDGAESIDAMADAAAARGWEYIGVTDHSYGLRIARGMSMADAERQHRRIDAINRRRAGRFRVLKGIEANILSDGGVDMTADELSHFDLVLAAPHSLLRKDIDQTERMRATVRHPGVHVLAHPRGRMYSRQGVLARWDEVFTEAHAHDVAVEIDGDPYRQDLDWSLAKRALEAGCLFAIDSDAHSGAEMRYVEIGLAHARLAGIPPARVINTWPAEQVLAWAERRRERPRAMAMPIGVARRAAAPKPRAHRVRRVGGKAT